MTTLFVILAREARTGVIFRRGPSKLVQLIRWDLRKDTLEHGQWFKGRVYERRCDLSPSGDLLVYFATHHRPPHSSWTAISRPPFFTALALWFQVGTYGGGGIFEDERTLQLNHAPEYAHLAKGFHLKRIEVKTFSKTAAGRGEDGPIDSTRQKRDGWRFVESGDVDWGRPCKSHLIEKTATHGYRLQEKYGAIYAPNRPWHDFDHRVLNHDGKVLVDLPETEWADWDGGDLLFARAGCLFRLPENRLRDYRAQDGARLQLIHDFNSARFMPVQAPAWARKW